MTVPHPAVELERAQVVEVDMTDGCIHVDKIKAPSRFSISDVQRAGRGVQAAHSLLSLTWDVII